MSYQQDMPSYESRHNFRLYEAHFADSASFYPNPTYEHSEVIQTAKLVKYAAKDKKSGLPETLHEAHNHSVNNNDDRILLSVAQLASQRKVSPNIQSSLHSAHAPNLYVEAN